MNEKLCYPVFLILTRIFKIIDLLLVFEAIAASQKPPTKIEQQIVKVTVGNYSHMNIKGPYVGLMDETGSTIGQWDDVEAFKKLEHSKADFLWFSSGSISWDFPLAIPSRLKLISLKFTAELASEAPGANWEWPSDIELSINDVFIGAWTLPGDPDSRHGLAKQKNHLPPSATQYGWLITWTVDTNGTFVHYDSRLGRMPRMKVSNITLEKLNLRAGNLTEIINVKLTVLGGDHANEIHGLNVFGHSWGDYDSDPTLTIEYVK
jgi:predicted transcriptional regulator